MGAGGGVVVIVGGIGRVQGLEFRVQMIPHAAMVTKRKKSMKRMNATRRAVITGGRGV
jgi:hypothetical protein